MNKPSFFDMISCGLIFQVKVFIKIVIIIFAIGSNRSFRNDDRSYQGVWRSKMVVQSNWMTRVIIMLYHISFTFKIGQRADGGGGGVCGRSCCKYFYRYCLLYYHTLSIFLSFYLRLSFLMDHVSHTFFYLLYKPQLHLIMGEH